MHVFPRILLLGGNTLSLLIYRKVTVQYHVHVHQVRRQLLCDGRISYLDWIQSFANCFFVLSHESTFYWGQHILELSDTSSFPLTESFWPFFFTYSLQCLVYPIL